MPPNCISFVLSRDCIEIKRLHRIYLFLDHRPEKLLENIVDFNNMDALSFDIDKLIRICRENDAAMVGVFGSVARGEDTSASDLDLMVKFSKRKSLLDIVRLEREISTELGKKVDLLTEAAVSPYLRDKILSELKVIYEN